MTEKNSCLQSWATMLGVVLLALSSYLIRVSSDQHVLLEVESTPNSVVHHLALNQRCRVAALPVLTRSWLRFLRFELQSWRFSYRSSALLILTPQCSKYPAHVAETSNTVTVSNSNDYCTACGLHRIYTALFLSRRLCGTEQWKHVLQRANFAQHCRRLVTILQ